jgi:vesicle coat complex subunit
LIVPLSLPLTCAVIKKVIGYQSIGIDVSKLFTEMAMAVATTDLVIKKMVYLYVFAQLKALLLNFSIS